MIPMGIEFLFYIAYIAFVIFGVCVLIRLYNTLHYAREAYKRYLSIDLPLKEEAIRMHNEGIANEEIASKLDLEKAVIENWIINSENRSTENDAQQSEP